MPSLSGPARRWGIPRPGDAGPRRPRRAVRRAGAARSLDWPAVTATTIDGRAVAADVRAAVAEEVAALVAGGGPRPGLATVLVGDDPASHIYVRQKRRACEELGLASQHHELPADATQEQVE